MLASKFYRSVLFFCVFFISSHSFAENQLVVNLGDSITAATLADTMTNDPRQDGLPIWSWDKLSWWFNLFSEYSNKSTVSWASGQSISSHFLKLRQYLANVNSQTHIDVLNVAVPGARSMGLDGQVEYLQSVLRDGQYDGIKYVTLMIGANDVCWGGTPITEMLRAIRETMSSLAAIKQLEPIRMLVSGLPRLPNLGEESVLEATGIGGMKCKTILNQVMKACSIYTDWSDRATYDKRMVRVTKINDYIRETVLNEAQKHPNMEVIFSDVLFQNPISPEFLAADCFHPNLKAHQLISDGLWADQPWFK